MENNPAKKVENKEKKGFGQILKSFGQSVRTKVRSFKEKHPVAYKVIGGITIASAAIGAGAIGYGIAKASNNEKTDDIGNNEPEYYYPEIVNLPVIESYPEKSDDNEVCDEGEPVMDEPDDIGNDEPVNQDEG